MKKVLGGVMVAMLLWLACCAQAFAATLTITAQDEKDKTPIVGAEFGIWRVADVAQSEETGDYDYEWLIPGQFPTREESLAMDNDSLEKLAADVLNAVKAAGTEAGQTVTIGRQGTGSARLDDGLYLVHAEDTVYQDKHYMFTPVVVEILRKNVDITAKTDSYPLTELTVIKSWKEDGSGRLQPKSITVQLLCDGEPTGEEVVLSQENNWRHTFRGLDARHKWSVREKVVPDTYTASMSQSGNVITITNTRIPEHGRIPQTGQPWWLVGALAGAGIVLFMLGFLREHKKKA